MPLAENWLEFPKVCNTWEQMFCHLDAISQ